MRRLASLAMLLLAGCATTSGPPEAVPTRPTTGIAAQRGALIGLAAAELVQRFGQPRLRLREGPGVKLQFASTRCVLDTYLYPSAGGAGAERVTHVDARRPTGEDMPQGECVAALSSR